VAPSPTKSPRSRSSSTAGDGSAAEPPDGSAVSEPRGFFDVAFTDAVKAVQARLGSRGRNEEIERSPARNSVTPELAAWLAERNSFFLGTASADGRPYIQHRGGPPGFLAALDEKHLAFADLPGNKQYITLGNLSENDRAIIFAIDYAHRQRIKLWGRAEVIEDDPALIERLTPPQSRLRPQRAIRFRLEGWDVNCPQHIPQLFTAEEVEAAAGAMLARIQELEEEVARLKGETE
jgi:predicted pyridoxine 5'-phosphate oxidase superfamily flavin-nucleotide-binding protein